MNTDKLLKLCKAYQEASAWAQKARAAAKAPASPASGSRLELTRVLGQAITDAAEAANALLSFLEEG